MLIASVIESSLTYPNGIRSSDERTPGTVAVVNGVRGLGNVVSRPPSFTPIPRQILGGVGGQSPPNRGGDGGYLDAIAIGVQPKSAVATKTSIGLSAKCPGWFVQGECENGHRFMKEIYCGREWCPVCGADESPAHKRRFSRWVGKAQQLTSMGYLVFTIPEEVRGRYRTKAALNELTKRVTCGDKSAHIKGMLTGLGFARGLSRWHWFGDTPGKWHPHLNVLIEAGYLSEAVLEGIRGAWAGILGVDVAVVNYSYTRSVPKMVHILQYVTRATFRDYSFDGRMAAMLYDFRNMRSWGKWDGPAAWELSKKEAKVLPIAKLESGLCPCCGEKITWGKAMDISYLQAWKETGQAEPLGAGYYSDVDKHCGDGTI